MGGFHIMDPQGGRVTVLSTPLIRAQTARLATIYVTLPNRGGHLISVLDPPRGHQAWFHTPSPTPHPELSLRSSFSPDARFSGGQDLLRG
jgi:hypothetical protein